MAAHFQLGHLGVLVPDGVDDAARAGAALLLFKDAGPRAGAQPDHPARGPAAAVQHLHQGGLARPVGPGDDQPLAAADGVGERLQQDPVPDADGQVLHDDQLVPGLHVVFKAEAEPVGLVLGGLGDLELFQLFAAALGHFGGGGPDQVAVDVVLQLFGQGDVGVVLFLAQSVGRLFLGQIGREVALVDGHGPAGHFPDLGTDVIQEIAVVADHHHRAGISLEVRFQPLHGGKVQVVGGLVQDQDVRLFQQELGDAQPRQLAAGQHPHVFLPGVLGKTHAAQHLFDVHIHVVAIGGVHDGLQGGVLFQQGRVAGAGGHFALHDLHLGHGVQHRGKGGAHLPVDIQSHIQLGVLGQIPHGDAVGQAELAGIVGVFTGQDLEQGRFAGAVLAHDADAVLPLDAGRHVFQHDLFPKALADLFQVQ